MTLKEILESRGESGRALARRMRISPAWIVKWKKGATVPKKYRARLIEAFPGYTTALDIQFAFQDAERARIRMQRAASRCPHCNGTGKKHLDVTGWPCLEGTRMTNPPIPQDLSPFGHRHRRTIYEIACALSAGLSLTSDQLAMLQTNLFIIRGVGETESADDKKNRAEQDRQKGEQN